MVDYLVLISCSITWLKRINPWETKICHRVKPNRLSMYETIDYMFIKCMCWIINFLINRSLKSFAFSGPHNLLNTAMLFFSMLNIALFLSLSLSLSLKQHLGEKASLLSDWIVSNWMWLLATIYRILLHDTDWIAIISEHQTSKGNNHLSGGRFGCIYIYYHVGIIETFDCAFAVQIKWYLRP